MPIHHHRTCCSSWKALGNLTFRDRLRIGRLLTDRSHNWTLICVTADPLLASLCDRVIVLQEGQIVLESGFDDVQKTEHYERIFREKPGDE
ncbi:MAG: hypothetical protein IPM98_10120 [Lewinellaceae bacterium]|nr:hypothetical protein [Lewinellaceae bacterium]